MLYQYDYVYGIIFCINGVTILDGKLAIFCIWLLKFQRASECCYQLMDCLLQSLDEQYQYFHRYFSEKIISVNETDKSRWGQDLNL